MQDVARHALSQYCSMLSGVADGLNLRYYPRRPTGCTGGVVVSPVGEDNPRLSSTVNLAAVLNTELDHALDELSRAHAEIAQLRSAVTMRMAPPPPSGLSNRTARLRVDTMHTATLTGGPDKFRTIDH
jgi:hypothetical protein